MIGLVIEALWKRRGQWAKDSGNGEVKEQCIVGMEVLMNEGYWCEVVSK